MTVITMAEDEFNYMSYVTWNIEDVSSTSQLKSPIFAVADMEFSMVFLKCDSKCTISMIPVVDDLKSTVHSYAIETNISVIFPNDEEDDFLFVQKTTNRNCSGHKECHTVWEQKINFHEPVMLRGEFVKVKHITFLCVFGPLGQYIKEDEEELESEKLYQGACLGRDLDKMRSKVDPSFVLKCEGKTLPVHEVVLSARSKIFADMLRNKKELKKEVEIKDMEFEVLENFITYMYSGRLRDNTPSLQLLENLYRNANKYKFEPLKFMASSRLVDILNYSKISSSPEIFEKDDSSQETLDQTSFCALLLRILFMADEHKDKGFKKSIILCIVRNNFILTKCCWLNFQVDNVMLANEVYDIFVNEYES